MKLRFLLKNAVCLLILTFSLTITLKAQTINCPPEGNVTACDNSIFYLSGLNVRDPIIAASIGLSATPGPGATSVTLSSQMIQSYEPATGNGFARFRFFADDGVNPQVQCTWRINTDFNSTDRVNCTNDLSIADPCGCDDPLNQRDAAGIITAFHDVLTVSTGVPNQTITLAESYPAFSDASLNTIPALTVLGTTDAAGILNYDFYHAPGVSGFPRISNGFTVQTARVSFCDASICPAVIPPDPIPTMGQWGLMIFGLLILNLSVFFMNKKMVFEV